MTEKTRKRGWPGIIPKARRRDPLQVRLTVRFHFGDAPEDQHVLVDDQAVPMVDSVFANRDRILRAFARLLVKGGLQSPAVMRELLPLRRTRGAR